GEVAGRADECPGALLLVQLAGARRLRRLLEQHLVALLREDLPPLLLRPVDPGDLGHLCLLAPFGVMLRDAARCGPGGRRASPPASAPRCAPPGGSPATPSSACRSW